GFLSLNGGGSLAGPGYFCGKYAPFDVAPSAAGLANLSNPDGQAVFTARYTMLVAADAALRTVPSAYGTAVEERSDVSCSKRPVVPGRGGRTQLDETLIVVKGEFGRTVGNITDRQGRDHCFVHSTLIAGGRVRGGRALGKTTPDAFYVDDPGWSEQRPVYAEDIAATIYSALGINYTTVPHDDPLGRGFEYIPKP